MWTIRKFLVLVLGLTVTGACDDTTTAPAGPTGDAGSADAVADTKVDVVASDLPSADSQADIAADISAADATADITAPLSEFDRLLQYLEGPGGNYLGTALPRVVEAADVMAEGTAAWVILDLRVDDKYGYDGLGLWKKGANQVKDFDDGHIAGAKSVALGDLVGYAKANLKKGEKILVVCYTGQLAGWGAAALNLLGYDAFSLKWGMSAWNPKFDLWSGATSSSFAAQLVKTADAGKNAPGATPTLATGQTAAKDVLEARLTQVLKTPKFVTVADVLAAQDDFYVVNYWPEAEYLDPGHLPGAHQYTPKTSLHSTGQLGTLPVGKKIAVYCYTGQTSAQVATYLNLLGYDAYSVLFGANAILYDQMPKQKWPGPATGPKGFATEPAPPKVKEFEALVQYLEGPGGNYLNGTAAPKVIEAKDVLAEGLENWVVLDTRVEDKYGKDASGEWKKAPNGKKDFDDGHIPGAKLVPLAEMATYAATHLDKGDKILVTCHSGQVAGHAVLALNLLGYNAYSLKWGMSSWNAVFDVWSGVTSSTYAGQFVKAADSGKNVPGAYPTLATGKVTVADILTARVADVLAKPRLMSATDLFAAPESFYIVNYWPEAEFLDPGHVPGAHAYAPKTSLATTALLNTLPTDKKIAVYCYTGQNSSQVAAYLAVLGYDAWGVRFGTNGMIYDNMPKQKWPGPTAGPGTFAYEETK